MPIHAPGEGETLTIGPTTAVVKATAEDTGGQLYLSETTLPADALTPPPHYHETLHDMFYVLDGTLTLLYGEDEVEAGPGTFACIPPGTIHTFFNRSGARVRFLNFSVPGGFESYLRDLAAASGPDDFAKIVAKYDVKLP
jgi:mannose-6-phosphate isomerase-like protein (cupin superfamily)